MAWRNRKGDRDRNPMRLLADQVRALSVQVQDQAPAALRLAGLVLEAAIKTELSKPGTGRRYKRGKRGKRYHIASKPGEPPAVDTGYLRNSVASEAVGNVLRVGPLANYAAGLEFGSVRQVPGGVAFVQPRPFMRPALENAKAQMTDVIVGELRRPA